MIRSVELTNRAARDLDGLAKTRIVSKILSKIESLSREPAAGKPLVGPLKGIWSVRIGNYRVLYEFNEKRVIVLTVNHRREVYR